MTKDVKITYILSLMLTVVLIITLTVPAKAANQSVGTYTALQSAMNGAPADGTEYIIEITGDIYFTGTLTIASGKNITLQSYMSGSGAPFTMSKETSGRHFNVNGTLKLKDIKLDGSTGGTSATAVGGGVQVNNNNIFTMENAVIQNCSGSNGGAVYLSGLGKFYMTGSFISGSKSGSYGGGVYGSDGSIITVTDSTINGNYAANAGAGIGGSCTITVNSGTIYDNKTDTIGGAIYSGSGSLTATNVEIRDNRADRAGGAIGGGYYGSVHISGGIIKNNIGGSDGGGAIYAVHNTITITNDTKITENGKDGQGNIITTMGGGIAADYNSVVSITGSTIADNASTGNGGGIYCNNGTAVSVTGGTISDNKANGNGGGAYVGVVSGGTPSSLTMQDSTVSGNKANSNGGGVYSVTTGIVESKGSSTIIGNSAGNNGGGIYTANTAYSNLTTSTQTIFRSNGALRAYTPPINAAALYPNIGFASVTVSNHPLNNYDINYTGGVQILCHLTYDANNESGNTLVRPDVNPGASETVLTVEETGFIHPGYTFNGWNTQADGKGDFYAPGSELILYNNMTLYAQWDVNKYIVTFESNEGTAVETQTVPEGGKAAEPANPTRDGYTFAGWYTDNNTFENAWDFDTTIINDMTLYAKWSENLQQETPTERPKPKESKGPTASGNPKTGDANMMIWILYTLFSAIGILCWFVRLWKENTQ